MKQLFLLIEHYSFLPLPAHWRQPSAKLPAALALLPLWGLMAGLLCWGAARLTWVISAYWGAALLLGINIALNGGVWLRDTMLMAENRRPQTVTEAPGAMPPVKQPAGPMVFGRVALLMGGLYLLWHYLCLLALLRTTMQPFAYVAVAVCCRFIYVWGVYDFAAVRPAFLHLGLDKAGFTRACLIALFSAGVCAAMDSSLWLPLMAALLLAWLCYRSRLSYLGALDEPSYGFAAAAAEILFYLIYVFFS